MADWQNKGGGGGWRNHPVSQPINMVTSSTNIAQSPQSESIGGGAVLQMVVENVLSGGSPASINVAKYMPLAADLTNDSQQLDDSRDDDSVITAPVTVPYAIPIPQNGGENVAGTPDFQFTPYIMQGGRILGSHAQLGSTPTGPSSYGYGSWNAVYTPGIPPAPMSAQVNGDNSMMQGYGDGGGGQIGPPAMFSCSPPGVPNLMSLTNNFQALSIATANNPNANHQRMDSPYMNVNNIPQSNGYHAQHPLMFMPFPNQPTPPPASLASSPNFFGTGFNTMHQMQMSNMAQGYPPQTRGPHSMYGASSSNSTISQYGSRGDIGNRSRRNNEERMPSRSHLLDEFRGNRCNNLQLSDLGAHVVEFAKDQHGSRFIQQKLERASAKEKQIIFEEVIENAQTLMTDVFGNYVIQKFFEHGTETQKMQLANAVRGNVMTLALQMYGCRVIQKALESIDEQGQMDLLKEMDGRVLQCVKDQNGNHVVQKIIEKVKPERLQFIIDAFLAQPNTVYELSIHPYGCRVIQRVLEHCSDVQKKPVLEALHANMKRLVIDQYGNYVVQHVVEHGDDTDKDRIVEEILGDVLYFAKHKFASNVIEKCLTNAGPQHKNKLIAEVCGASGSDDDLIFSPNPPLLDMMKDQYANYVVQKMLDVADSQNRRKIMYAIRPHINTLRKFSYGKHIITKLEKYFQKQANGTAMLSQSSQPLNMPHMQYDHHMHNHQALIQHQQHLL